MNTTTDTTKDTQLREIGKGAYSALADMVAALQCDYDRLEELRGQLNDVFNDSRYRFDYTSDVAHPDYPNVVVPGHGMRSFGNMLDKFAADEFYALHAEAVEFKELAAAAGDCESQDDARQRIEEDALSIEVRSGWQSLGETLEPAEYCILLSTGGPAVRIIGALDRGQPTSATLQVQDWFTPWTDYHGEWNQEANNGFGGNSVDKDVLLAYASVFYFDE